MFECAFKSTIVSQMGLHSATYIEGDDSKTTTESTSIISIQFLGEAGFHLEILMEIAEKPRISPA